MKRDSAGNPELRADLAGGGSETERKGVNGRKEKKRENGRSGSSQRKPAQGENFTEGRAASAERGKERYRTNRKSYHRQRHSEDLCSGRRRNGG